MYQGRDGDGQYFRLNIFGMGDYRELMGRCGMVDWEVGPPSDPTDWDDDEQRLRWQEDVPETTQGIAGYKLCSNDGWLVTPEECTAAVRAWREHEDEMRENEDLEDYWFSWVGFIEGAIDTGGFRVY